MPVGTSLTLPDACPCCGAGVKREVLEHGSSGPTLTRTYGPADARRCGATMSTWPERQAAGAGPNVIAGCREPLIKLLGGRERSPDALPPFDVDDHTRSVVAATTRAA